MARFDFYCDCGNVLKDYYKGVNDPAPECVVCHKTMRQNFGAHNNETILKGFDFASKANLTHGGRKP